MAVAGDDLVVEYDWFGLQVIKQYQAVLLHAETMEASDREEYVASNSIFIGYTAEVGKGGHDIVASGTRVIITQVRSPGLTMLAYTLRRPITCS